MAVRDRRLAELGLFVALTILHTWPLVTDPAHLSRLDNHDTAFNTWVVAWVEHQLPRDPRRLFEAPIFYPEHDTLAYSENLIAPAVMGLPLAWAGASPVLIYNVLVFVGFAASGVAMCRLITRWTGLFSAGVVAGALFAFNAHVLTRFAHLQALHMEFVPLALYGLDRLLESGRSRPAALLAAAFVLQSLCSTHMMVMLAAAIAAAVLLRGETWRASRLIWPPLVAAGAASAVLLLPVLLPYYRLHATEGLTRGIDEVRLYSAGFTDYLATAGRLHYSLWAHRFIEGRTALFPGIVATLLAGIAVASGAAWRDRRARLMLPFVMLGVLLSFGAYLPGYAWLQDHIPVLQGIRAAARWGYLALIGIAVLAGFGVASLHARWSERQWWPALVVALVGLVTIEAMRAPLALVRFDGVPGVHARMQRPDVHAIAMFPFYRGDAFHGNAPYLLDQTRHWKPLVNGYSSFAPQSFFDRADRLSRFPAPEAIEELRRLGVSHVMLDDAAIGRELLAGLRGRPELAFELDQNGWTVFRIR